MKLNKLLYPLLFSGLGAFSYLLLVNYGDLTSRIADALYLRGALIFFVLTFNLVGYTTLRLSSWINMQYTAATRMHWKIPTTYLAVMLLYLMLNYGLLLFAKILAGVPHPFSIISSGWRLLITVWLVELVILGLVLANRSMISALKLQRRTARLQAENDRAQYTALQNQLNPHFLFNSLNTLVAEIEYNPKNAVNFTKHLSSVYRYVLQSQQKKLVSLAEELEFTRSYLFLHEVRLGPCLNCEYRIAPDATDAMLPPLTLQLLVENVIKHNSITAVLPMTITLTQTDDLLTVSNPIHPKISTGTSGVGLQNLSKRYQLMSGCDISIEPTENTFTVKVPLLYE